ncbi:DUF3489 domain-containing protein [Rhizorhabdus wittichii]|uniref:DUF3489 domain-containing protein n=1 Tax=Rhizorhabdus wittichii TaxID=160791 RepID=UPI0002FE4C9F|nr:DUF3489 domain-containing protein [Rhizorhabdus wittichii]
MEDIPQTTDSASVALARPSKATTVTKLLSRNRGATLAEIMEATHWQPHSARSFLSGIRKTRELLKETRRTGETSYRLAD